MNRFVKTLVLAAVLVAGAWTLYHRDQIHSVQDAVQLARRQFLSSQWMETPIGTEPEQASSRGSGVVDQSTGTMPRRNPVVIPAKASGRTDMLPSLAGANARAVTQPSKETRRSDVPVLRIATMRWETDAEAESPQRIERLARILADFDITTIQVVDRAPVVAKVVAELNRRGRTYRFIERRDAAQSLAMVFDVATVGLDQSHWYTVNDPDHVLTCEPLVAWFRARRVPHQTAFTFTLVNVMLDPRRPDRELPYLGDLFRAVRNDGRGEDDVILAGDFHCGDRGLRMIQSENGFQWAIANRATTTDNELQQANIVFNPDATIEFTGEAGVFDLVGRLNLTLQDAMAISKHMPVWAEFSLWEGHSPGRVTSSWPE